MPISFPKLDPSISYDKVVMERLERNPINGYICIPTKLSTMKLHLLDGISS